MNNARKTEIKTCSRCRENLPVESFPARKTASDGLSSGCRRCHNENVRAVRQRKRDRARAERSKAVEALNATLRERHRERTELFERRSASS